MEMSTQPGNLQFSVWCAIFTWYAAVTNVSVLCSSSKLMSVQRNTTSLPSMSLTLGGKAVVQNRRSQKPINRNPTEKEVSTRYILTTFLSHNKGLPSHNTM